MEEKLILQFHFPKIIFQITFQIEHQMIIKSLDPYKCEDAVFNKLNNLCPSYNHIT